MTASLTVTTPAGELLDLTNAEPDRIAEAVEQIAAAREHLDDLEEVLSRELIRRLDRRGEWTLRVRDQHREIEYEITAPSPDAGTTAYDAEDLEAELTKLIARDVIDQDGAAKALDRKLTIVARVPFGVDHEAAVKQLQQADDVVIAGLHVEIEAASLSRKAKLQGINALGKVPGAKTALERTKRPVAGPVRKAKVKATTKEQARARAA